MNVSDTDYIKLYHAGPYLLWPVGIARRYPTSGTRTPLNQYFGEGLNLQPFLKNVYKEAL